MMALGFTEILLLLFLSGGAASSDLAGLVPAQTYFKSRSIEISVDKAIELAGKDPVDGKAQIAQLVALRYLEDEAAKLKNSPSYQAHRQLLAEIAAGRKAQDPQGFAKEYAERVLSRLDGRKPAAQVPALGEALRWFPADADLLGAIDLRPAGGDGPGKLGTGDMFKMIPPEMLNKAFGVIEKVGNIRIERIAFAYVDGPKGLQMGKFYMRVTGKANQAWLLEGFKELDAPTKTVKGPQGETITTLSKAKQPPAIAVIGDTDLVLAGYLNEAADHEELIAKVLDVRAGKAQHAGEGSLKMELTKVPAKACGLVVGRVPAEASQGAPFPMPVMINAHLLRVDNAIDLQLAARMTDEQDAKTLVQTVSKFRMQGIEELKKLQGQPIPLPGLKVGTMIQVLESMQIQAEGSTAKLRMLVPEQILSGGAMFFGAAGAAPPPPPKDEGK